MWKRSLRDAVVRFHVGNLRVFGLMDRSVMEEVARRWRLPLESEGTNLLGEYMAGTAMRGSFFKGEERVKVISKTPTIQELYVEAMAVGKVRGKATYTDLSRAGSPEIAGSMHISKVLYGAAKPYNTSIEASGVPEVDWQRFFDVSEQVSAIVRIDSVATNDDTGICGVIVQRMPPTMSDERQYDLEISQMKTITDILEYLNALIPGAEITDKNCKSVPLDYYCRCSKGTFRQHLRNIGTTTLKQIAADVGNAGVELTCNICNYTHHLAAVELEDLINSLSDSQ
ncbi:hypothetical protein PsorP6_006718 [Peronosclerospora sorghi]|uniref:Uncharacterized protein n=1 Tax=Peronosclerospora sorghi TaxID=230839 RepID=A0ACC0W695_9STRA|nr:hypothetical protein PsorP6_006718 [Peronosclerospora sorghi]